jgi:ubiquinone/menaquinone biosynthesis C-methylase UbiE
MSLKVKFGHAVMMCEPNKKDIQIGKVVSFNDSDPFGTLPNTFFIRGFKKLNELGDLANASSFLLGFDPIKDYNKEIIKFHGWLFSNPGKCANVVFDKYESTAVLVPALYDDESQLKSVSYQKGFVCKVLVNKNPNVTVSSSSSSFSLPAYQSSSFSFPSRQSSTDSMDDQFKLPSYSYVSPVIALPTPSLSTSPASSVTVPSSLTSNAAEDHYNKLKRKKETRHLSQLFHMRNLNNFVKAELIEEGALLAQRSSLSQGKSVIVGKEKGISVLDLACGKGGDMNKWFNTSVGLKSYTGVDIAENSLKEFVERLENRSNDDKLKVIKLIVANLNTDSLSSSELLTHQWLSFSKGRGDLSYRSDWKRVIPLNQEKEKEKDTFDIISCQFAMHYMFENKHSCSHFFHEISNVLKEKGYFIATTIDYRILLHCLIKAKYGSKTSKMPSFNNDSSSSSWPSNNTTYDAIPCLKSVEVMKNDGFKYIGIQLWNDSHTKLLLQINFREDVVDRLLKKQSTLKNGKKRKYHSEEKEENGKSHDDDEEEEDYFGIKYTFSLLDNEDEAAVDAPEYIVPLSTSFYRLLSDYSLNIYKIQNFHEFVSEKFNNDVSRER